MKTDRRDAKRLARLFAAGELGFVFVTSEADERFGDLVRCIDDVRRDLMRARHRLSKFLLRRGVRFQGKAWTQQHERWLCALDFEDPLSQAVFVDYLAAVQGLAQRRKTLGVVLEAAVPDSSHAETVGRLRCFRSIDTLTAAGLCAEVGDFTPRRPTCAPTAAALLGRSSCGVPEAGSHQRDQSSVTRGDREVSSAAGELHSQPLVQAGRKRLQDKPRRSIDGGIHEPPEVRRERSSVEVEHRVPTGGLIRASIESPNSNAHQIMRSFMAAPLTSGHHHRSPTGAVGTIRSSVFSAPTGLVSRSVRRR